MKTVYKLADGSAVDIEISEEVATALAGFEVKDNNEARNARRHKNGSLEQMHEFGFDIVDNSQNVEELVIQKEQHSSLLQTIGQLSPKHQTLIQKHYFEGKKLVDIARELGVGKSALSHQFKTIKQKLKKLLQKPSTFSLLIS